jgi:hypothetical protein
MISGTFSEKSAGNSFAWSLMSSRSYLMLRTGVEPIAKVMRRLLAGHAIRYNRRHERHGHLFQNHYKSILCQENLLPFELVRYTHLISFLGQAGGNFAARSLLCFWTVRELGASMAAIAPRLNISTVAESKSVARGAEIAKKDGLDLA